MENLLKLYSDFANFEKEFHNVDLGNSYLSDTSCHKSESYLFLSVDIIYDEVKVIVEHFKSLLPTNHCSINHLKEELEVLHDHIIRYVSKLSSERCCPIIFRNWHDFRIHNLLHVLEICLTAPLSNAEQRVFIFVAHIFQGTTINEA